MLEVVPAHLVERAAEAVPGLVRGGVVDGHVGGGGDRRQRPGLPVRARRGRERERRRGAVPPVPVVEPPDPVVPPRPPAPVVPPRPPAPVVPAPPALPALPLVPADPVVPAVPPPFDPAVPAGPTAPAVPPWPVVPASPLAPAWPEVPAWPVPVVPALPVPVPVGSDWPEVHAAPATTSETPAAQTARKTRQSLHRPIFPPTGPSVHGFDAGGRDPNLRERLGPPKPPLADASIITFPGMRTHKTAVLAVFGVFALGVLLRLPTFSRPLLSDDEAIYADDRRRAEARRPAVPRRRRSQAAAHLPRLPGGVRGVRAATTRRGAHALVILAVLLTAGLLFAIKRREASRRRAAAPPWRRRACS